MLHLIIPRAHSSLASSAIKFALLLSVALSRKRTLLCCGASETDATKDPIALARKVGGYQAIQILEAMVRATPHRVDRWQAFEALAAPTSKGFHGLG